MGKTLSITAFVLTVIAVSWYLYLETIRNSSGASPAGNRSVWPAIGAVLIVCLAASLMFFFFLHGDSGRESDEPAVSFTPSLAQTQSTPEPFDMIRWEQRNPWLVEGQADDRMPMLGPGANRNGSLSAQRSATRRTQQKMYKKWSQARHD